MPKIISLLLACWLATAGVARAQTLDKEMSTLAGSLSKALVTQGSKNVAAIDFTDLQGQPTELGRFLSEQLAVEMVMAGGVSMLDRANIKSILAEHKLTEEGLVNPANAKKLGEFAGVDAILIGTVISLDASFVLTVKAIATESSKIVAAGKITFQKTPDLQGIGTRSLPGSASGSTPTGGAAGYQDANAIATKDVGALRVVLKSVATTRQRGSNSRSVTGIRCIFEFINRDTQRPILVALNAIPGEPGPVGAYLGYSGQPRLIGDVQVGNVLRSTLVDESGTVWTLPASGVTGISIVSAGKRDPYSVYSPSDVPSLLRRQDDTGTNTTSDPRGLTPNQPYAFVFGSPTEILPGQSVTVPMAFAQQAGEVTSNSPPRVFQIVSEIVVGVVATGARESYSLQNLTFDRVSLPAAGGR
ncbi:MAG TPA: FlgO family outer membrane protein [Thermoanaerobaculia bacterium]|nr:FlgO family outer membrane protein [Thermoanaerobaculia bacterium]